VRLIHRLFHLNFWKSAESTGQLARVGLIDDAVGAVGRDATGVGGKLGEDQGAGPGCRASIRLAPALWAGLYASSTCVYRNFGPVTQITTDLRTPLVTGLTLCIIKLGNIIVRPLGHGI